MAFPVFFDTCSIYGSVLTDLILRLAEGGAFRPLWSQHVLQELEENLAERIGQDAAARRVGFMRRAFPDAEVTGYELLIDTMANDPKDRHVLAAAVCGNAAVIVTFNLDDFPDSALSSFDIIAIHPDEFLLDQFDLYRSLVVEVFEDLADTYERPPMTVEQLLSSLAPMTPQFVAAVRGEF